MNVKVYPSIFKFNSLRFVFFIVLFLLNESSALAQGDLLVFPKRIEFEGRDRVEQVILSNIGNDSATYSISLKEYRMTEQGEFVSITEPDFDQRFASPFLRIFPRRVNLAPGESQTVKIQVINTDKMEEGEYRSHLYFRAEKDSNPLGKDKEREDSNTISVKLDAVFGISIATIIRKGTTSSVTSISETVYDKEEESKHFLNFNINRTGNMSTYGDITVEYISRENKLFEVGIARGVAVYTPGNVRKIKMQLQKPKGVNFIDGMFKVVYTENQSKTVIAEAKIQL